MSHTDSAHSRRRVLFNTISNYAGQFISLTTWFFLTPFVIRQLGDSRFGLWTLVGALVAYGTLFDFGIAEAVTKYVAEFRARGSSERAAEMVATALTAYSGIGVAVTLVGASIAPLFPRLFNVDPADAVVAGWLVFLSGLGIGIAIPTATTGATLRGLHRFDLLSMLHAGRTLLHAGAIVLVLRLGYGVIGMSIASTVLRLLMQIPAVILINRLAPELRFGWRGASRGALRDVFSFSWPIFLIRIGGQLESKTDELVIGAFLPVATVGPYAVAQRLSTLPQMITEQFLSLILPLASELYARREMDLLRDLYITASRITLAVFLPLGLGLAVLARPFLTVWVGAAYAAYDDILMVLLLAVLLDTLLWPGGLVLQGMSRHRFPAVVSIGVGVSNLLLSIVLVQNIGLIGVALGTLIPTTISAFFLLLPYVYRNLNVTWQQAVGQIFFPPLLPALLLLGTTYLLREWLLPDSFIELGLIGGASALVYFVSYIGLTAGEQERTAVRDLYRRLRSRFG